MKKPALFGFVVVSGIFGLVFFSATIVDVTHRVTNTISNGYSN